MEKLLALVLFFLISVGAHAVDGVSAEYGYGDWASMERLGLIWNWDRTWHDEDDWQVTAFWEAMIGMWQGEKVADPSNQRIAEIGLTPVFRLQQKVASGMAPYLEGGFVGMHLISPAFIYDTRKFGGPFQFGNHLGFGVRLGSRHQVDVGYRFQHMSNADTRQPNNGINVSQLHVIYHF